MRSLPSAPTFPTTAHSAIVILTSLLFPGHATLALTSGLCTWFSSAWPDLPDFCMTSYLILFSSPLKCYPIQRVLREDFLPLLCLHIVCISDLLAFFSLAPLSPLENLCIYFCLYVLYYLPATHAQGYQTL